MTNPEVRISENNNGNNESPEVRRRSEKEELCDMIDSLVKQYWQKKDMGALAEARDLYTAFSSMFTDREKRTLITKLGIQEEKEAVKITSSDTHEQPERIYNDPRRLILFARLLKRRARLLLSTTYQQERSELVPEILTPEAREEYFENPFNRIVGEPSETLHTAAELYELARQSEKNAEKYFRARSEQRRREIAGNLMNMLERINSRIASISHIPEDKKEDEVSELPEEPFENPFDKITGNPFDDIDIYIDSPDTSTQPQPSYQKRLLEMRHRLDIISVGYRKEQERQTGKKIEKRGDRKKSRDVEEDLQKLWQDEGLPFAKELALTPAQERNNVKIPASLWPVLDMILEEADILAKEHKVVRETQPQYEKIDSLWNTLQESFHVAAKPLTEETIHELIRNYLIPIHITSREIDEITDRIFLEKKFFEHQPTPSLKDTPKKQPGGPQLIKGKEQISPVWTHAIRTLLEQSGVQVKSDSDLTNLLLQRVQARSQEQARLQEIAQRKRKVIIEKTENGALNPQQSQEGMSAVNDLLSLSSDPSIPLKQLSNSTNIFDQI